MFFVVDFSQFFFGFSIDFCKGRISPNTLPKFAKIHPLQFFFNLTPVMENILPLKVIQIAASRP